MISKNMPKVTGKIIIDGKGEPIESGFRDGFGLPVDGLEGIFPIFCMHSDEEWAPIGTGFFISNNGLFATAKHVLVDNESGKLLPDLVGAHIIRRYNRVIIREIIKVYTSDKADVAIGMLKNKQLNDPSNVTNKFFSLTKRAPKIGDKVVTYAFPKPKLITTETGFEINFIAIPIGGFMKKHHPAGRDRVLMPTACFQTSMELLGGASGGPVGFGDGNIFGINSTGYEGTDISFVSSITDLWPLKLYDVCLPSGNVVKEITIKELIDVGLVAVDLNINGT